MPDLRISLLSLFWVAGCRPVPAPALPAQALPAQAPPTCPSGFRPLSFINKCSGTIWPGAMNLATNDGNVGGWTMATSQSCAGGASCPSGQTCDPLTQLCASTFCVPSQQASITVWARTGCSFSGSQCPTKGVDCCDTGGCDVGNQFFGLDCTAGPANGTTVAEISFATSANPVDTYDASVIDGYNVGIQVSPVGATASCSSSNKNACDYWCTSPGCANSNCLGANLKACSWSQLQGSNCPSGQQKKNNSGDVVACQTGKDLCAVGFPCQAGGTSCTQASQCCSGQCNGGTCGAGPNDAFACTTPISQVFSCKATTDCPLLTGFLCSTSNPCPSPTVCTPFGNISVCQMPCSGGVCQGAKCTSNSDCTTGLLGTFTVCDLNSSSPTYQTCVGTNASLFEATGPNGNSCYQTAGVIGGATSQCAGCPTDSANSLSSSWPGDATSTCTFNNTSWVGAVQPSLATFKAACPTAYSFPFDDPTSTFTCASSSSSQPIGYDFIFCPN